MTGYLNEIIKFKNIRTFKTFGCLYELGAVNTIRETYCVQLSRSCWTLGASVGAATYNRRLTWWTNSSPCILTNQQPRLTMHQLRLSRHNDTGHATIKAVVVGKWPLLTRLILLTYIYHWRKWWGFGKFQLIWIIYGAITHIMDVTIQRCSDSSWYATPRYTVSSRDQCIAIFSTMLYATYRDMLAHVSRYMWRYIAIHVPIRRKIHGSKLLLLSLRAGSKFFLYSKFVT